MTIIRIIVMLLVVWCGVRTTAAESNTYIVIPLATDAETLPEWYPYCFTKLARVDSGLETHYLLEAELCSKQSTERHITPRILERSKRIRIESPRQVFVVIEMLLLPTLPGLPPLPVLPSALPDLASLPGLPTLPYLPGLPELPGLPVLPALPMLPITVTFR